jgi:F0F1-type ATP synthase assembly protein I
MTSPNPAPQRGPNALLQQFALAMELPFIMVGGVLIGGGFGYLLDRWLDSSPALTLVGGLLGFVGGMWDILRRLSRAEKKRGNGDGGG